MAFDHLRERSDIYLAAALLAGGMYEVDRVHTPDMALIDAVNDEAKRRIDELSCLASPLAIYPDIADRLVGLKTTRVEATKFIIKTCFSKF